MPGIESMKLIALNSVYGLNPVDVVKSDQERLRLLFMMFHPECFVCGTPVQFLFSNERRILNGRL